VYVAAADLPYHIIVGMPALSPTMEAGNLAEWHVAEGSEFIAGDSLARIETDKATIDFEAQDDGVVAKILMVGGTDDVKVGTPIMVTVEDAAHVAAFANFKVEAVAAVVAVPPPVAAVVAPPAAVVVAPPPPPPVAAAVVAAAAPPPPPVAVPPPSLEAVVAALAPVLSTSWGGFAKINSPIAKTLSADQQSYLDKYGATGFKAL
jgi:pyruvate dehydrogenase E2 component (dihydrolipoamide acetyltransferase)